MKNEKEILKQFSKDAELRSITGGVEMRSEGEEGGEMSYFVEGKGIVFNTWTTIVTPNGITFREMILPSALEGCDMSDVVSCRDHALTLLCSRTTGKTDDLVITVGTDAASYRYKAKNECAEYLAKDIELGFIKGSSFIFRINEQNGSTFERIEVDGKIEVRRTITKIDKIYEMGAVTFQAYQEANAVVSARSAEYLEDLIKPFEPNGQELRNQYKLEKLKLRK